MSRVAVSGILAVLHASLDMEHTILDTSHYILYCIATAMQPRMLVTLDEELNPLPVSVRVGQAVRSFLFFCVCAFCSFSSNRTTHTGINDRKMTGLTGGDCRSSRSSQVDHGLPDAHDAGAVEREGPRGAGVGRVHSAHERLRRCRDSPEEPRLPARQLSWKGRFNPDRSCRQPCERAGCCCQRRIMIQRSEGRRGVAMRSMSPSPSIHSLISSSCTAMIALLAATTHALHECRRMAESHLSHLRRKQLES